MSEPNADVKRLLAAQKRYGDYIANFAVNTCKTKAADRLDATDLDNRLALLEEYWNGFKERDDELHVQAGKLTTLAYFKDDVYTATLNNYLGAKHWVLSKRRDLEAANALEATIPTNSNGNVRPAPSYSYIQKVNLPTFSGDQLQWDLFKEKFTALILHDESIPTVIKFEKHSGCVDGEARQIVDGYPQLAANFNSAWQALCSRYDNQILRFNVHMQAIVQLPGAQEESASHISTLLTTIKQAFNTFTSLERPVNHWDDVLVFCLESKLATETKKDWVRMVETFNPKRFPTFDEMKSFLEERLRTLDMLHTEKTSVSRHDTTKNPISMASHSNPKGSSAKVFKKASAHLATQQSTQSTDLRKCSLCGANHLLAHCRDFQLMTQPQRKLHVTKVKLCDNCLSPRHTTADCPSHHRCFVCNGHHHSRLHPDQYTMQPGKSEGSKTTCNPKGPSASTSTNSHCFAASTSKPVLLSTACVTLQSPEGHSITVRALWDSGSEESFISQYVAQALQLRRRPVSVAISGIGGETSAVSKSRVAVMLRSPRDSHFELTIEALVLQKLTTVLPTKGLEGKSWPHLQDLPLADSHFGTPSRIDCILNTEVYSAALREGLRRGEDGSPIALFSVFGWLIMGPADTGRLDREQVRVYHARVDHELTDALTKFWETEEVPFQNRLSAEDQQCYAHFKATDRRNSEGRFVVRLPFKQPPTLSGTRPIAASCLRRIEQRRERSPELANAYRDFMQAYEDLGHIEKATTEISDTQGCYLSHHAVFKTPSKIRVVFNASQKDAAGQTLNSFLYAGPKLQADIIIILIRWAFYRYVFTCDVVKMFRQFLVHHDDADWQRILWRYDSNKPLEAYRLLTVTYGTACAPFLSNACMLQLADDEQQRYPDAAEVLRNSRYADDFFAGGGTPEEAILVRDQLLKILASAGMTVGKWATNYNAVLENLGETLDKEMKLEQGDEIATLGVRWEPKEDIFYFKVTLSQASGTITKRKVLSEIARLFDPVGWLSPVIVRAKLLLQNLWLQGLDWDEPVSPLLLKIWQEFKEQLKELETIKIPRWYGTGQNPAWQLHGFSDASERVYAATIYLRFSTDGVQRSMLISAKSRISPIKVVSLPKLELCGAVMLARLITAIVPKLDVQPEQVFCWTDSRIVLDWLRSHPSRWKPFVGNRVSEIITLLPSAQWRHVRSTDNPADLATRGVMPAHLRDTPLWWHGPTWLQRSDVDWPTNLEEQPSDLTIGIP